jgi:hypothetical protein
MGPNLLQQFISNHQSPPPAEIIAQNLAYRVCTLEQCDRRQRATLLPRKNKMNEERWYVLVDGLDCGPFTEEAAVQFAADANGLVIQEECIAA